MKRFILALAAVAAMVGGPRPAYAEQVYNADLVNDQIISIDTNYDLDLTEINRLSMVATYSTATLSAATAVSFDDGKKSTAQITVVSYADLIARPSTFTVTITSASTALNGAKIIVTADGTAYQYHEGTGRDWLTNSSTVTTATNLAAAMTTNSLFDCAGTGNVVICTATTNGYGPHAWTITSSTVAMTAAGPTNGRVDAAIVVNSTLYKQGTNFTAATSNAVTAKAISDMLMADSAFTAVAVSTWASNGVVYATAAKVGATLNSYTMLSSTPALITVTAFSNGQDPDVDVDGTYLSLSSDTFRVPGHGLRTGEAVLYATLTGTAPGGLTTQTTYYAIRTNGVDFKLASSKANASAGTAVNITSLTGSGTFRLTPIGMSGTAASFKWQVSNDGTNFFDYATTANGVSVSSFTWSAAGTTGWDFGEIYYKKIRLKYLAPATFGGIDLAVTGTGRRD
jgi:hypothetical protein